MICSILNIILILVLPFLFLGTINRVKSIWAGRQGPSIIQPLFDFLKLLRKGEVISTATTFIFRMAPSVNLAAVLLAAMLVPLAGGRSIVSFEGDFILFAYVLGLGKFFTVTAALDTGSSFEGMGASREATFGSLVEPAFFLILGSLCLLTGTTSFQEMLVLSHGGGDLSIPLLLLCIGALFIMLLTEGSRVPVDDPNTHLELTMIHEVMILDNSGPDLAFIMYGAALKMVVITALIAAMMIPQGMSAVLSVIVIVSVEFITAIVIGCIESVMARFRMSHVSQLLFFMSAMAVIIFSTIVLIKSGGLR